MGEHLTIPPGWLMVPGWDPLGFVPFVNTVPAFCVAELEACSLSRTQRGAPFLLDVSGHAYIRDKESVDKTFWKCQHYRKFNCKVSFD